MPSIISSCLYDFFQLHREIFFCLLPLFTSWGLLDDNPHCAWLLLCTFCHHHCQTCLAKKGHELFPLFSSFCSHFPWDSSCQSPTPFIVIALYPLLCHCFLSCCPCSSFPYPQTNVQHYRSETNVFVHRQLWARGGLEGFGLALGPGSPSTNLPYWGG